MSSSLRRAYVIALQSSSPPPPKPPAFTHNVLNLHSHSKVNPNLSKPNEIFKLRRNRKVRYDRPLDSQLSAFAKRVQLFIFPFLKPKSHALTEQHSSTIQLSSRRIIVEQQLQRWTPFHNSAPFSPQIVPDFMVGSLPSAIPLQVDLSPWMKMPSHITIFSTLKKQNNFYDTNGPCKNSRHVRSQERMESR